MKRLGILGSTGSIGVNCLNVVESLPAEFNVAYLAAHSNAALLFEQTQRFRPAAVAIVRPPQKNIATLRADFKALGVELLCGLDALVELAGRDDIDVMVNAVVGSAGLPATLRALENGTTVALANKETLVTGGELVMACAKRHGAHLVPIDSEHSALWQCLLGEPKERIQRLIVTASGGPFRERSHNDFANITVAEALNHPNWSMGPKITIDSATMMNKGLEVIEAFWLFELSLDKIDVVIHPQSIIHSMVEFVDGSIKAQLSVPDMRMPIQYALTYPDRLPSDFPRLDFNRWRTLTFHAPDFDKFPCLRLATQALQEGGTAPAVLNAANEEAVQAFLEERLRFDQIPAMISETLQQHRNGHECNLANVLAADRWARTFVQKTAASLC
ncbi:1-deoxy-D-xylulose-5-phosphate reductoisomerase [candidate division KSB1 bacterium]|nr:MAG: 1-deoxy-D-xylulose-5-phosphate reductoisomerase [candidate division KSB1 bacterium]MBC6949986.1 1-deoxy-D-xylulose-5-phosphate reductoisomerase [candidate division KSB1 bacterium]MCE7943737.1 1-deoxy-D-xylulose-5-phosphate reductoisomerase [Chlorobi bacterium CHB1]